MRASHRRRRPTVAALVLTLGLAVPSLASAAVVPAPAPSAFNSTPDCPVSAAAPVCGWNVPLDAANVFTALDYGQCPYWAAEKYPALVSDAVAADPLELNWDGGQWLANAQSEGLETSTTPAPGDLAVWQAESTDLSGHVAYVEAVTDGGIIVSQMDGESVAPIPALQGSTEYFPDSALAYFAQAYGLAYVVTGDSPTTPLSYVEAPAAANPPAPATTVVTTPVTTTTTVPSAATVPTARRRAVATKTKTATKTRATARSKTTAKRLNARQRRAARQRAATTRRRKLRP